MTTVTLSANDPQVESRESRRPAQTIKVYILLAWTAETAFLFFGMIIFPQLHPSLIGRLIWTQIFCGVGMGAAGGAIAYMAASGFKQGSRAALILTAIGAVSVFVICANVCTFVDKLPGMDYWGSHENPALFEIKGNLGGALIGIIGSWLLNTKRGMSLLDKIPFLR